LLVPTPDVLRWMILVGLVRRILLPLFLEGMKSGAGLRRPRMPPFRG